MNIFYYVSVLVFILVVKNVKCCNFSTFNKTSVILNNANAKNTVFSCFGPTEQFKNVFSIKIINETVPVLYAEAFYDLNYLVDIKMENIALKEIKPNCFLNLPSLYSINIKHNNIKKLINGIFNNLTLSELYLMENQIEEITTEAFDNLPNLTIIDLNNNKIKEWDIDWFRGTPNINMFNFQHNCITKLPSRAFKNVKGTHLVNALNVSTTIHLNNNKIEILENGTFAGLETLGWLFLQRNQIREFNVHSLGNLRQLDWLRLDYNELECIPEKLLDIAPNVKYYLQGNPLTEECIQQFAITNGTNNGIRQFSLQIY